MRTFSLFGYIATCLLLVSCAGAVEDLMRQVKEISEEFEIAEDGSVTQPGSAGGGNAVSGVRQAEILLAQKKEHRGFEKFQSVYSATIPAVAKQDEAKLPLCAYRQKRKSGWGKLAVVALICNDSNKNQKCTDERNARAAYVGFGNDFVSGRAPATLNLERLQVLLRSDFEPSGSPCGESDEDDDYDSKN